MIDRIDIFMGEEPIKPSEIKNYICVSDYVCDLVNDVYYKILFTKKSMT